MRVPGVYLRGQCIRPIKLVGMAWRPWAPAGGSDLPLQRAPVVLLPVLPGAMGGPGTRDFSALWVGGGGGGSRPGPFLALPHAGMEDLPGAPSAPGSLCSHWVLPWAQSPPPSLHRPPHADAPQVGVEVEEGADAEWLCHDVAERWPL